MTTICIRFSCLCFSFSAAAAAVSSSSRRLNLLLPCYQQSPSLASRSSSFKRRRRRERQLMNRGGGGETICQPAEASSFKFLNFSPPYLAHTHLLAGSIAGGLFSLFSTSQLPRGFKKKKKRKKEAASKSVVGDGWGGEADGRKYTPRRPKTDSSFLLSLLLPTPTNF